MRPILYSAFLHAALLHAAFPNATFADLPKTKSAAAFAG